MKLVLVSAFARGHFSNSIYEEEVVIKKESYEKIKDKISELEIYIGGLDGKHSQEQCYIDSEETKVENHYRLGELKLGYHKLSEKLERLFEEEGLNYVEEDAEIEDYLSTLDHEVEMTVVIRKSQQKQVEDFINNL